MNSQRGRSAGQMRRPFILTPAPARLYTRALLHPNHSKHMTADDQSSKGQLQGPTN